MRKKIELLVLVLVMVVGFFAVTNAHSIDDYVHSLHYSPPADIADLAFAATMNNKSKGMFYRFSPELLNQTEIDSHCGAEKLGCTEKHSIYILQYSNKKEFNQSTVTAAHEMLHVAYSRLSNKEKEKLKPLFDAELNRPGAAAIADKLKGYPADDYYDEAHSFIGTELPNLSPELNTYYAKYFEDRQKLTEAYLNSPQ